MEGCMEATAKALKPSLRRELATEQVFFEDMWCATGISGVPCEDFSVDDLLDFSNGDFEEEEEEVGSVEEEEDEIEKDSLSVSSSQDRSAVDIDDNNSNSSSFDASHESFLTNELVEPVEEIAELEWVSQFVDDSSRSEFSVLYPYYAGNRSEPEQKPVMIKPPCLPSSIPSKTRTKRTRPTTSRVWSLGLPVLTDSPASSSSSSGLSSTPCLIFTNAVQSHEWLSGFDEPAAKKLKKKPPVQTGGLFQRRCSHCQTQRTPQWRTGPLGPKTLCNACGVRFKSGRLFPEYRPACSPTFSKDVHSNSHRKVLEMRKKKEVTGPEVGLTHMVQSF